MILVDILSQDIWSLAYPLDEVLGSFQEDIISVAMKVSKPAVGEFAAFHHSKFVPRLQNETLIGIGPNSENIKLILIRGEFALKLDDNAYFIRCATPLFL